MEESGVIRTTEQLPYAIEGFPKGKRNQLVHEMYTSEFTYVQGLEVLIDVCLCICCCCCCCCCIVVVIVVCSNC